MPALPFGISLPFFLKIPRCPPSGLLRLIGFSPRSITATGYGYAGVFSAAGGEAASGMTGRVVSEARHGGNESCAAASTLAATSAITRPPRSPVTPLIKLDVLVSRVFQLAGGGFCASRPSPDISPAGPLFPMLDLDDCGGLLAANTNARRRKASVAFPGTIVVDGPSGLPWYRRWPTVVMPRC